MYDEILNVCMYACKLQEQQTLKDHPRCRSNESPFRPKSFRTNFYPLFLDKVRYVHQKMTHSDTSDNSGQKFQDFIALKILK
jgi:hypothetical protein